MEPERLPSWSLWKKSSTGVNCQLEETAVCEIEDVALVARFEAQPERRRMAASGRAGEIRIKPPSSYVEEFYNVRRKEAEPRRSRNSKAGDWLLALRLTMRLARELYGGG